MKMIKYFLLLLSTTIFAQESTQELSIYFNTDSALLSSTAIKKIEAAIVTDENTEVSNIFLTGYCDDRGSIKYNEKLALSRVWSVIDYLKPRFAYSLFNEAAIGELPLENSNNINEQRAQNRRLDIIITYIKNEIVESIPEPEAIEDIEKYKPYDILKDSLKVGTKLVFNNVIFYPGRHVLRESSYPVMDSITNSLLLHKKYEIEIQGHICCLAAGQYGRDMDTGRWNLSQARAEEVKRFLIKFGVKENRLKTVGKQSNFKTGKGDYFDRRVEIHITGIREEENQD